MRNQIILPILCLVLIEQLIFKFSKLQTSCIISTLLLLKYFNLSIIIQVVLIIHLSIQDIHARSINLVSVCCLLLSIFLSPIYIKLEYFTIFFPKICLYFYKLMFRNLNAPIHFVFLLLVISHLRS
jgi:hypothetical protein